MESDPNILTNILVLDSKQFTEAGGTSLGLTKGGLQLSENWINQSIKGLPMNSPVRIALETARDNGTLRVAVGGVNRSTGQAVIVPIKFN